MLDGKGNKCNSTTSVVITSHMVVYNTEGLSVLSPRWAAVDDWQNFSPQILALIDLSERVYLHREITGKPMQ